MYTVVKIVKSSWDLIHLNSISEFLLSFSLILTAFSSNPCASTVLYSCSEIFNFSFIKFSFYLFPSSDRSFQVLVCNGFNMKWRFLSHFFKLVLAFLKNGQPIECIKHYDNALMCHIQCHTGFSNLAGTWHKSLATSSICDRYFLCSSTPPRKATIIAMR